MTDRDPSTAALLLAVLRHVGTQRLTPEEVRQAEEDIEKGRARVQLHRCDPWEISEASDD